MDGSTSRSAFELSDRIVTPGRVEEVRRTRSQALPRFRLS